MAEKKTDRRIIATKKALKNSLIKLLDKKHVSRITVTELCEDADLNRGTFYAHYADQFALRDELEKDLISDIKPYFGSPDESCDRETVLRMSILGLFEYIDSHRALCKVILSDKSGIDIYKKVEQIIMLYHDTPLVSGFNLDDLNAKFTLSFLSTGVISVIKKWLFEEPYRVGKEVAELVINYLGKSMSSTTPEQAK